jgi:hypothetical protein
MRYAGAGAGAGAPKAVSPILQAVTSKLQQRPNQVRQFHSFSYQSLTLFYRGEGEQACDY